MFQITSDPEMEIQSEESRSPDPTQPENTQVLPLMETESENTQVLPLMETELENTQVLPLMETES